MTKFRAKIWLFWLSKSNRCLIISDRGSNTFLQCEDRLDGKADLLIRIISLRGVPSVKHFPSNLSDQKYRIHMVKVAMAPIRATVLNMYYTHDPHAKQQLRSSSFRDTRLPKMGSNKNTDIAILFTPHYCEFRIIYWHVLISYQI